MACSVFRGRLFCGVFDFILLIILVLFSIFVFAAIIWTGIFTRCLFSKTFKRALWLSGFWDLRDNCLQASQHPAWLVGSKTFCGLAGLRQATPAGSNIGRKQTKVVRAVRYETPRLYISGTSGVPNGTQNFYCSISTNILHLTAHLVNSTTEDDGRPNHFSG